MLLPAPRIIDRCSDLDTIFLIHYNCSMAYTTPEFQVALVGAGPIGIELAVALKQFGVNYVHFEAGQLGQTLTWWPRSTRFFSSPERIALSGVPINTVDQQHITGEQYLAYLRGLVEHFDLAIHFYEPVVSLKREAEGGFRLVTRRATGERRWRAERVVLAIGGMHAPNRLDIPGEDLPHVSHYFDEPHRYFRQRLVVVGGGNSAVEAALRCWRAGADVTLSYRHAALNREEIKPFLMADFETVTRERKMRFLPNTVPVEIRPGEIVLAPTDESGRPTAGPRNCLPADFVLLLTGHRMDPTLLEQVGVNMQGETRAPEHDPETMETNVPGLYVAGVTVGGSQMQYKHFIETSHAHVPKILRAITGRVYDLPVFDPSSPPSETR